MSICRPRRDRSTSRVWRAAAASLVPLLVLALASCGRPPAGPASGDLAKKPGVSTQGFPGQDGGAATASVSGGGAAAGGATGTTLGAGATGGGTSAEEAAAEAARANLILPRLARFGDVIESGPLGPANRSEVALTFNASESKTPAGFDRRILEVLLREQASATVFMAGKWLSHNQDAAKEIAADRRIEIGDNSWDCPDFTKITDADIASQITRTDALIQKVTGRQPVLFRLPYGTFDARVLAELERLRAPAIQWSVVSGDPDPNVTAAAMKREILRRAQPGSIVIMHINGRGVHTAEMLPDVIRGLRAKGFKLVTVSTLLR
jgi:peptidoglycan-N-acetylglucosamine deacetylase